MLEVQKYTDEEIIYGLISALEYAIDLIDQYEEPRKKECGSSSVTRDIINYVLIQSKEHTKGKILKSC